MTWRTVVDPAIARTCAEDVVWHEPDRVNRGRAALTEHAIVELHTLVTPPANS